MRLLSSSLPSLAASPDDWQELAQLRYALEVGAIELAIRKATDEQIDRLAEITRADGTGACAMTRNRNVPSASTWSFTRRFLRMTGSRLIAGMQQVLVQFFQIAPHSARTEASAERISWEHRELLNAIRDRDVERARAMIRLQIRPTLDRACAGRRRSNR